MKPFPKKQWPKTTKQPPDDAAKQLVDLRAAVFSFLLEMGELINTKWMATTPDAVKHFAKMNDLCDKLQAKAEGK